MINGGKIGYTVNTEVRSSRKLAEGRELAASH